MNSNEEAHPYNLEPIGRIPEGTRLLIVGTAPPPRFSNRACGGLKGLDFNFFYGSEDNYTWLFLEEIAAEIEADPKLLFTDEMSSEDCCRVASAFLQRHRIWMRDVLQRYHRKIECSASDSDIVPVQFTDFRPIFCTGALAAVAFTSEQAADRTFEALAEQGLGNHGNKLADWKRIRIRELSREQDIHDKFEQPFLTTQICQREIQFYMLPTPTGRSRMGLRLADKLMIYRKVLFEHRDEEDPARD